MVGVQTVLEAAPAKALGLVASVGRKQGLDPGQLLIVNRRGIVDRLGGGSASKC
jgi:hypothetical protein